MTTWQERVRLLSLQHDAFCYTEPNWTQNKTATSLSLQPAYVSAALQTARYLHEPRIANASTLKAAYIMVKKKTHQRTTAASNQISEAILPPAQLLLQPADFLTWAPQYTGPKFDFVYCDLPIDYVLNIERFIININKILKPSGGYLMIWFSMSDYTSFLQHFLDGGLRIQKYPLVWLKSNRIGPQPNTNISIRHTSPRRVYETALIVASGYPILVRSVQNAYAAPANTQGTKPVPMLEHFFQMFIDKNTHVLDAFCTNDNAIQAATRLGARYICGLRP